MASQGPNSPNQVVSVSGPGTYSWSNPTNAQLSDNYYAMATISSFQLPTQWLQATNFGFSIPQNAVIDGIVVEVEKKRSGSAIKDNSVRLIKNGTVQGNDKANPDYWPTSDTYVSYGSSNDTWGLSFTPQDINNANFGVALSAWYTSGSGEMYAYVDHIRITVYYTVIQTAQEDLKTHVAVVWPQHREYLKTDIQAYTWYLEFLKAHLAGDVLMAFEHLKTHLRGDAWAREFLKTSLVGHVVARENLKCHLASKLYTSESLKCHVSTADRDQPYVVLASLSPSPGQRSARNDQGIVLKLRDDGWGINVSQCWVEVAEIIHDNAGGESSRTTTRYKQGVTGFSYQLSHDKRECSITITPPGGFGYNRKIEVTVFAVDLAGNCGTTGK